MEHNLEETLGVSDDVKEEPEGEKVLNIFIDEDNDNPGTWKYGVYDNETGSMVHPGFTSERAAIEHAVKTYKAKRQVTVLVTVELEDPNMKIQDLVDMISGRAATIQGVNAMKANGYLNEEWFEAPYAPIKPT